MIRHTPVAAPAAGSPVTHRDSSHQQTPAHLCCAGVSATPTNCGGLSLAGHVAAAAATVIADAGLGTLRTVSQVVRAVRQRRSGGSLCCLGPETEITSWLTRNCAAHPVPRGQLPPDETTGIMGERLYITRDDDLRQILIMLTSNIHGVRFVEDA